MNGVHVEEEYFKKMKPPSKGRGEKSVFEISVLVRTISLSIN